MLVDGVEEWEVDKLLRHRRRRGRRARGFEYLVLWKGRDLGEASWQPEADLENAPDILEAYWVS